MGILDGLFYFLSFYFFALLCYIPFADRLKRTGRRILLETALLCFVLAALPVMLYETSYSGVAQIASVAFYFLFFLYYKKTVQDGVQKLLFVTFIAVHTLCMGTELEFAVTTLAGAFPLALPTPAAWYALFFPVRIALYLAVGFIVHRVFTPRLREIKSGNMKGLLILPAVFASISIYRGADYFYKSAADPVYPITFLLLAVASFFVYWQMLRMLDSATKNARLEIETQRLEMKTDFYHQMAHDIRTPLTKISTNIQVANMGEVTDHERLIKSQAEIMEIAGMIDAALEDGGDGSE
jgi:signal transduction histidine kinase